MWIACALGSALFAGVTSILSKCGIRHTDSTVATAIRTIVVLAFSWLMAAIAGSIGDIGVIAPRTWLFLVLSGLCTGASWLCYFRALQLGEVNRVAAVDKSSAVLTIILSFIFLGEGVSWAKGAATAAIAVGTFMMLERGDVRSSDGRGAGGSWLIYAVLSAVFASLTTILGKVGIEGVESNLGTAIRTCVVLVMAWAMVFITGKQGEVSSVAPRELAFILLSGITTGASWLCYYRALQLGPASAVVPIDKLSLVVSVVFSRAVFGERLSRRAAAGLALIVAGTLAMAVLS